MYKKLSFEQLQFIRTAFWSDIKNLYTQKGYMYFKQFLKKIKQEETEQLYFIQSADISFRFFFKENNISIIYEKESLQLDLNEDSINKFHNYLKKQINNKGKKSIGGHLQTNFSKDNIRNILGADCIIYDIETVGNINNLEETEFMIAYCVDSSECIDEKIKYRYISKDSLDRFIKYLIDYNGYIVGYNNISFDNVVLINNSSFDNKEQLIEKLNKKSIDLFVILQNLLKKRLSLNFVATNIVGISKTLSGGDEGMKLLEKYKKTKDQKILNKVKNYCKNDVKMTLNVFLYLVFNGQLNFEGQDYMIDNIEQLLRLSRK